MSEEFEKWFNERFENLNTDNVISAEFEKAKSNMKYGFNAARELDAKRIAELEEKAKIASELINYVMGADDYDTNYKDDDCIYIKHFKDLVSINSDRYVKATVFESLMFAIDNAKISSNPFEFLCNQIQSMQNTEFSVKRRESYSELESQNKVMCEALKKLNNHWAEKASWHFTPLEHDLHINANKALALKKEG